MKVPTGFGQYVPGDSVVHRLDSRAKMLLVIAFTVAVFGSGTFAGLGLCALAVATAIAVARVPWRVALRGVRAVTLLLAITLAAQSLRWMPVAGVIVRLGPLGIDAAGLVRGAFFAGRIVLLVVGTSLLTLTTSPVDLTYGLESFMRPLSVLGFPSGDVAMMLSVALRFIPTTAEEAEKVITAQTARGARFDEGGPLRRARAYVPVLIPLFVGLFRRSDELAAAMEARGWRGGAGRTRLKEARMGMLDWTVLVVGVAACVIVAALL